MNALNPRKRRRQENDEDLGPASSRKSPLMRDEKQRENYRKTMFLASVKETFRKKAQADYQELLDRFSLDSVLHNPDSFTYLRHLLVALTHVVSQLDRFHYSLVEAILGLPWVMADPAFVKSYIAFSGVLVSARPEYSSKILQRAISGLTYQSGLHPLGKYSSQPLRRRDIYNRQHELLQHILSLIPTLSNELLPILLRNFPHKRLPVACQITYIRNILRITQYYPELSEGILATIIDRAVQIDVEIQVELGELEEEDEEADPIFEIDPFDKEIDACSDSENDDSDKDDEGLNGLSDVSSDAEFSEPEVTEVERDPKDIKLQAAKLDAMLKTVFEHLNSLHDAPDAVASNDNPPPTSSDPISLAIAEGNGSLKRSQFRALLTIFERIILRTFRSRYTQFLIFWYSSLDHDFANDFLGSLSIKALIDQEQATTIRTASASYIGSFVSRAQFVDSVQTQQVVKLMCWHLSEELATYANLDGPVHATRFSLFYAVAQAVFLIFCFRWRDLLEAPLSGEGEEVEDPDDVAPKRWIPDLNILQRVVMSELNPLKVCSPNVVRQFAKVARITRFMYCDSIINVNKRSIEFLIASQSTRSLASSDSAATNLSGKTLLNSTPTTPRTQRSIIGEHIVSNDLATFFPFDPYTLESSHEYIDGIYRQWSSVAVRDDDDDDGDSDDDDEAAATRSPDQNGGEDGTASSPGVVEQGGISFHTPFGRNMTVSKSAEDLNETFGGMSISPVQHMGPAMIMA
ncbi:uncharacterized protein EI90DRAFT_3116393 [Cantharellus anzutake]|uniref:uncharacterized protein n=1 Tax=Cantharellus anzutake TaxID=1750568 RepID=UPI001906317C|nr:uncharacterized protein EI90DRAFT_3116393 [Cantharellus anzutake]KAF8341260.1 hypothetical protein EI90DRAFT_3116393 [Cantharellus anzutake]